MNKTSTHILALTLLSTSAFAEPENQTETPNESSGIYMGIDFFNGETEQDFDRFNKVDHDQKGFRLKLGAAVENGFRIQGTIKFEEQEETGIIFSGGEFIKLDDGIFGLSMDAIKTFSASELFYPFIQIGAGYDWRDIDSSSGVILSEDSQAGFNLKFGVGGIFKVSDKLELLAGFDWQHRTWQEIEVLSLAGREEIEQDDNTSSFNIGLNFLF